MNISTKNTGNVQKKMIITSSVIIVSIVVVMFCVAGLFKPGIMSVNAQADPAVTMKLGFVDFDTIVKDCEAGKKALETIKSFHSTRQQEITTKENSIMEMEKSFDQQKYTLSSEAREKRLYELEQQKLELKRFLEDSEREMEKLNKRYIEPIKDDVFEYIKKFGQANGYGIIFDKTRSTLIYTHPDLDLTQKIVTLYNQAGTSKSAKP